jgi:diguanylate cyclase
MFDDQKQHAGSGQMPADAWPAEFTVEESSPGAWTDRDDVSARRRIAVLESVNTRLRRRLVELQREVARARHLANHDELTGLPNRRLLMDRLRQSMARALRQDTRVIVLMLDLDGFKETNDTLGHLAGDQLLQEVAARLSANLRGADTACRYGGDEFVVMLPDIDKVHLWQQIASVAAKLRAELDEPFLIGQSTVRIAASIGVAIYPDDGHCDHELLRKADKEMYRAKEGQAPRTRADA